MDKIKTAAYCRVSTDKEAQDGSYELQVSYFTELINANPTMEFVGIYGDKGRSGLSTEKRPGLQKLMDDCRAGKINLILTKSISRFARNMADCAAMIRELKELGVNIIFEKENINSQDEKCALVLNIFAAIAEEESHSISQHALLAHEQYTLEGRPFGQISFGYKNGGDHKWVINEEEAPLVRKAFQMAAEGKSYTVIREALNKMGTITWRQSRLKYLLTNVVYKGDYHSHKTISLVPGKQVKNNGYRDRFYITGHHEPIVSPELFDWVQEVMNRGILVSRKRLSKEEQDFLKGGERFVENSNEN
jgi:DNA invertase Pin-like site-specific DNA recombinase